MSEGSSALDVLGIKGISDSIKIATEKTFEGASAFLSRVCLPAAEEFGLAFKDRVSAWRAKNAYKIFSKANDLLPKDLPSDQQVHPRIVHLAFDEGSWCDDQEIQQMWAGLLASSISHDGKSDDNLIFVNILKLLSSFQARLINYAIQRSEKFDAGMNLAQAEDLTVSVDELMRLFAVDDIQKLDRELDQLRGLGLLSTLFGGIDVNSGKAEIHPSDLAIHLYVRSQGSKLSPVEFWKLKPHTKKSNSQIDDSSLK